AVPGVGGRFEHEFRDVRGDFTFTLRGGDDRGETTRWTVVVRIPPRVAALRADLEYPGYLALPPRRVEGGSFSVPEGTKVTVSFEPDVVGKSGPAASTGPAGAAGDAGTAK